MMLEGFAPQNVLRHFEEICKIPHGTGYEDALCDHIAAFAKKNGLAVKRDAAGNLFLRIPASAGCAAAPPLLLQGHMDMVCVQDGSDLDMETEPICLLLKGNVLYADGSSLGADNAVGLSCMMALMEPLEFPHPPLELLFTVEEEIGLVGIQKFDFSQLCSRQMITMDCGDPDVLVTGAAGGDVWKLHKDCRPGKPDGMALCIEISGLRGGHAGLEIGKNSGSAVELGGRLLNALCGAFPTELVSLDMQGSQKNLPDNLRLTVAVPYSRAEDARKIIAAYDALFSAELAQSSPGYTLCCHGVQADQAVCAEDTQAVADLLLLLPCGVLHRDAIHPEWILSSALLTWVEYNQGRFVGRFSIQFHREEYHAVILERLRAVCRLFGVCMEAAEQAVPPWPMTSDSPLRDRCLQIYEKKFGAQMRVEIENGSVEPSIIVKALPEMDCVGFAPKSRGAHTTKEHLYLDTVAPVWDFLTALLRDLAQESF